MIWSLVKILVFIGVAAGLTYGAGIVLETPGEVRLAFAGRELNLSPLGFLIAVLVIMLAAWVVLKIAAFIVAILRFLSGDQTAISRFLDRNRERKGFDALSQSMIALAAGEGRIAQAKAQQAEKLLNRPDLTRLVNAQAAVANGNHERALGYYKEMLSDESTRFVGIKGLLKEKLDQGDTDTALKLAEKAFQLRPKNTGTLDTLFDLQSSREDWAGARKTLTAKVRAQALPKDVGRRRDAVLSLADARSAMADNNMPKARDSAYAANRLAPMFVPAAALAAELHAEAGEGRQAARIVRKAWSETPHPELAAAFAAIAPDETPEERLARFQPLLKVKPDDPETKMVAAELALAAEDFPAARRALGTLAETDPTTRSLALMAAIEKGEGAPDHVVRGWLAKALDAPQARAWTCNVCQAQNSQWSPICENCESFDTLSWAQPPAVESSGATAAMLPLIVGALSSPPDETASATPDQPAAPVDEIDTSDAPAADAVINGSGQDASDPQDAPPSATPSDEAQNDQQQAKAL